MRYTISFAIIAIALQIGAQKVPPNTTPATVSKSGSGIEKLDTGQKAHRTSQATHEEPNIAPCAQLSPCYVIEQPQVKTKEEQAKEDSLDLLYRCYLWETIIGVVGALIGVVVLISQTIASRKAAIAAKDSADALVSSERAWVLAELDHPDRPHTYYEFSLFFRNHGPTPARIEDVFWDITAINSIGELPNIGSFGPFEASSRFIGPQQHHQVEDIFPNASKITNERWQEIANDPTGAKYVVCYGCIRYTGIFKGERITRFCFGYNASVDRFVPIGPREYNKAT